MAAIPTSGSSFRPVRRAMPAALRKPRKANAALPRRNSRPMHPAAVRQAEPAVLNVLFLCTGNSARSILAEAILSHDGQGRFKAFSAGSNPAGAVNPWAVHTLKTLGYPAEGYSSKSWNHFAEGPEFDLIFTV